MLKNYVDNGGDVQDLTKHDPVYVYIKNKKIKGDDGQYLDLETKFNWLGFPRKPKLKDNKQELVAEIEAYKQSGDSFHVNRKKLPFYSRLYQYSRYLKKHGKNMTYEQIMKSLGYKDFSDIYYRCQGLKELPKFRDSDGYVDSYRKNNQVKGYILALADSLGLPYYLVVTLLADEKLKKCHIATEYIDYVKTELQQFVKENGTLKGLKAQKPNLYAKFRNVMRYYSDGAEMPLSTNDWLNIFELNGVENRFKEREHVVINIEPIMTKLKQKFGNSPIALKDIDNKEYELILQKAVDLGIPLKELFRSYNMSYSGNITNRLSSTQIDYIPYLDEMKKMRDDLLAKQGITEANGYCKEEVFEAKFWACKQAYNKYKNKIFNFVDEESKSTDVTV